MNPWSRLLACLALCGLTLLTVASAQDKDKVDKAAKKDVEKKDPEKKDDAKKPEKKTEPREPAEEKVVYGSTAEGKIKRFASESNKDFVVEVLMPDPKKMFNFKKWQYDQQVHIASTDPRNPRERALRMARYQQELAKKQANPLETHSAQDVEVRAGEKMVVRSLYPPPTYDEKGNLKTYTAKELAALRGRTKLPGYPADLEDVRVGSWVTVYLAKVEAPKGGIPKKKLLEDDVEIGATKPEVVMLVIKAEPMGGR